MRHGTRKLRGWLITVLMLFSVAALGLPTGSSSAGCDGDQCCECQLQCANEAWYYMMQCYQQGRPASECQDVYNQYSNNCKRLFCRYGGLCN